MSYRPNSKSREERISDLEEQIDCSQDILRRGIARRNEGIAQLLTGIAVPTVVCGAIALATGENPYHVQKYYLHLLSKVATGYGALLGLLSAVSFYQSIPTINSARKEILSLRRKLKTYR